jgi:AcrR family transcriptional regulator
LRLTRDAWIRAAYRTLESKGVEGVQILPLSRTLRVTRGSFYWHFEDRAELLDALLEHWSRQSRWFRLESDRKDLPRERLEFLVEAFTGAAGHRADRSMLRWAQGDPRIAQRVSRVLKRRLRYVSDLLRAHGLPAGEAVWRGKVISFA